MTDDILQLLKMHDYFRGLSDEALQAVAQHVEAVQYETGDCVYKANTPISSVGFLVRGRLKMVQIDAHGREQLYRFLERGDQYGMISAAMPEPLPIAAFAIEPSTVLMLDYEVGFELTIEYPELRRCWSRAFAVKVRKAFLVEPPKRERSIVAVFHESPRTRCLTDQLLRRLSELNEALCVLSDRPDWKPEGDVAYCSLLDGDRRLTEMEMRRQVNQ